MLPKMTTKNYLCGVDYQHEMEEGFADFYPSVEELKNNRRCWKNCGIVEISLDESGNEMGHKWILAQKLWGSKNDKE